MADAGMRCGVEFHIVIKAAFVGMNASLFRDIGGHNQVDGDLSACSTWIERTEPPRSTSATIARLFDGPVFTALGVLDVR
jgi:hypothetical protein